MYNMNQKEQKKLLTDGSKGVIFYSYFGEINGSLINAFEYYISILEYTDVKLVLLNTDEKRRDKFFKIFEDRYNLDDINWKKNIVIIDNAVKVVRERFDTSLIVDWGTIYKIKDILMSDKIVVIQDYHPERSTRDHKFDEKVKNVKIYREMPFDIVGEEYKMKFLFHRFKRLRTVREGIYVNSPKNDDLSFLKTIHLPNKPIIVKSRDKHKDNLFEYFDTYLYYHADTWFDPSPRLFIECEYYGKNIMYYNPKRIIDGSWYRFHDILENGIENRYFNENDEVIREFLN